MDALPCKKDERRSGFPFFGHTSPFTQAAVEKLLGRGLCEFVSGELCELATARAIKQESEVSEYLNNPSRWQFIWPSRCESAHNKVQSRYIKNDTTGQLLFQADWARDDFFCIFFRGHSI